MENYGAPLDEVLRAKPTASKDRYLKKATVSTTSPGIPVDPSVTRNFAAETDSSPNTFSTAMSWPPRSARWRSATACLRAVQELQAQRAGAEAGLHFGTGMRLRNSSVKVPSTRMLKDMPL
jgi:hypothetical protein